MSDVLINPNIDSQATKTYTKLQNIILPNLDICSEEELFLRVNSKCMLNYQQNIVELRKGGIIKFDTYFNALSVQKWKNYTDVKNISINLHLKGAFQVKLWNINYFSESAILVSQNIIDADTLSEVSAFENIDIHQYKGLLYLEIEALENNSFFKDGYIHTDINNFQKSNLKIAVVMCTYKRETYVHKNVKLLENHFIKQRNFVNKFEFFIIDNGRTLTSFNNPKIHLVSNKNAGGSGGYTRGILEVLKRKNEFSHIIFMDDDVVIAPEVFERIYNFQVVANDNRLCIGGSMLKLDTKHIQHENGAIWDDAIIRLKPDLDLRTVKNILFNEIEEHISYNGWWLFCFPTKNINDFSLPYPFFIRGDDIEWPLRLKLKIVTLNGICVWHESFENKFSPIPNYYSKKNEIILSLLYSDNFGKIDVIKQILRFSLKEAFCYRYKNAQLILKAFNDLLQGPEHLKSINPEEKNLEIRNMGEKLMKNYELPFLNDKYEKSLNQVENTIHRGIRFITLNGHLLPSFLFHKDNKPTDNGYKVVSMQKYRPVNVFRARKVLYYNLVNQEGFAVRFSRIEFFKVFIKTILLSLKMFFKFSNLRKSYRETLPELTNRTFWENYLEINKYSEL
jgi:GT2 family glycosyltransferase